MTDSIKCKCPKCGWEFIVLGLPQERGYKGAHWFCPHCGKDAVGTSEEPELIVPLVHSSVESGLVAKASRSGDKGIYNELAVCVWKGGELVCDMVVTTDPATGDLKVFCSANGNGEVHKVVIRPMKPIGEMIEPA